MDVITEKEFLTPSEVSYRLGVSTQTIYNWKRAGRLTPFRISPRCVRYKKSDIDKLVADLEKKEGE